MTLSIDELTYWGATIRGPLHRETHLPNQDSWRGKKSRLYAWVSVCDGMGSRSKANLGSKEACRAVQEAIRIWVRVEGAPAHFLLRLIRLVWETRLSNQNTRDCATTCLAACVLTQGRVVIAGLGDGLAVIRKKDGSLTSVMDRGPNFSNQTNGLGDKHTLDDWKIWESDHFESGSMILLASDGIADDLDSDKLPEFMEWLKSEHGNLPPRQRYLKLQRMLSQWPTPLHTDDKTLAVLYRTPCSSEMINR